MTQMSCLSPRKMNVLPPISMRSRSLPSQAVPVVGFSFGPWVWNSITTPAEATAAERQRATAATTVSLDRIGGTPWGKRNRIANRGRRSPPPDAEPRAEDAPHERGQPRPLIRVAELLQDRRLRRVRM